MDICCLLLTECEWINFVRKRIPNMRSNLIGKQGIYLGSLFRRQGMIDICLPVLHTNRCISPMSFRLRGYLYTHSSTSFQIASLASEAIAPSRMLSTSPLMVICFYRNERSLDDLPPSYLRQHTLILPLASHSLRWNYRFYDQDHATTDLSTCDHLLRWLSWSILFSKESWRNRRTEKLSLWSAGLAWRFDRTNHSK